MRIPTAAAVSWILTSRVYIQPASGVTRVTELGGSGRVCFLRVGDDSRLRFSGWDIDVGDAFVDYLGLLDEASDGPITSEPWSER